MPLTLLEAAKTALNEGAVLRSSIIEMYAESSDILANLPFETISGNAMRYNREETLPGVGFRGVNEAYTESTGVINPITEPLVIAGGEIDVDKFIVATMGPGRRTAEERMKVKALAQRWTKAFIKGDSTSDAREFDGLQSRLTGTQKISAGSTSGGAALSLAKLDEAIDAVDNPTHLIMNRTMRRRLSAAARLTTVGGYITYDLDAFGRRVTRYNDLPILTVDQDNTGTEIMQFNEAPASGASTATSIYVVSFGNGTLEGIQGGGGIMVDDLGELESKPAYRTRVEWYSGLCVFAARAACRLYSIGDLAVVA